MMKAKKTHEAFMTDILSEKEIAGMSKTRKAEEMESSNYNHRA